MEGDEEREYTFIGGQENSVIDYILIDTKIKGEIKNFRIEERVESDHLPMALALYVDFIQEKQTRCNRKRKESGQKKV